MKQITDTLILVRPHVFRSNEQTKGTNSFQQATTEETTESILSSALEEFDTLVQKLKMVGVSVFVLPSDRSKDTPDAIFPNNWISFHENAAVVTYPMHAENRRAERREDILDQLEEKGYFIEDLIDYSSAEEEAVYLEGTGSMVLDRKNRKAFCAISERSDESLFIEFCEDMEYTPIVFSAFHSVNDEERELYHTNVMMSIGSHFAIVCLDAIPDKKEKKFVLKQLKETKKEIIPITLAQLEAFAANVLEVKGRDNQSYLVLSETAKAVFTKQQLGILQKHCILLSSPLDTIEKYGGGSARCMLAEVFLPKRP